MNPLKGPYQVRLRWNLFARELEDILATRGVALRQIRYPAEIHQEKVRRLRVSLRYPKSFPTLNPDELERVARAYELTDDERLRLRAAILATAVETLLMNRIESEEALRASEQVFPLLLGTLRAHPQDLKVLSTFRRWNGDDGNDEEDEGDLESDPTLDLVAEMIDRGTLALHLCDQVGAASERLERARQARDAFQMALDELDQILAEDGSYAEVEAWMEWREEAEAGRRKASRLLADNGDRAARPVITPWGINGHYLWPLAWMPPGEFAPKTCQSCRHVKASERAETMGKRR